MHSANPRKPLKSGNAIADEIAELSRQYLDDPDADRDALADRIDGLIDGRILPFPQSQLATKSG